MKLLVGLLHKKYQVPKISSKIITDNNITKNQKLNKPLSNSVRNALYTAKIHFMLPSSPYRMSK